MVHLRKDDLHKCGMKINISSLRNITLTNPRDTVEVHPKYRAWEFGQENYLMGSRGLICISHNMKWHSLPYNDMQIRNYL